MIFRIIAVTFLLSIVGCSHEQPEGEKKVVQEASFISLENAPATPISFQTLSDIFLLGSDYTDLQRETAEQELIGKTVQWELPVYEISRNKNGTYVVTTEPNYGGSSHLSASVLITARNDKDRNYLTSLKTNDLISFKGTLSAVNLRLNVTIAPAIVSTKASQ